jgi:hypothetical protein
MCSAHDCRSPLLTTRTSPAKWPAVAAWRAIGAMRDGGEANHPSREKSWHRVRTGSFLVTRARVINAIRTQ